MEAGPFWPPLHSTFITGMQGELKARVPPQYSVWPGQHVWIHEPDAQTRLKSFQPDVTLSKKANGAVSACGLALLAAPAKTLLPAVARKGNRYLHIKEVRSERVVTAIELLSPANKKPGADYESYLSKRNEYFATGTNLVEIDLLRDGKRMPMGRPRPPKTDYYVLICRAIDFPGAAIWPWSVRERLPDLPIPLNPEDGFVNLPLQTCFDWAYDLGPYDKEVDYRRPPKIRLKEADAAWAKKLLAAQVVR
ncbi:MAG: DUF4058 family protein [Gemmataceae bacterium]|nr:DUF4058 family protein [Gemmataceae bacterium]